MANDIYFPGLGIGNKVNDNSYTIINNPVNGKPSKIKISNFFEAAYENGYITDFGDTSSNQEIYTNAATTDPLENCTYNNGTDGIGATLTKVGNGAFPTIDGVATKPNHTYLVKNQVNLSENGVYELTTVGSGGASWVLTRIALFDESPEIYPATVTVLGGTTNGNTLFFQKSKTVTDIGTSSIIFQRINSGTVPTYEPTTVSVYLVDIATVTALPACTYASGTIDPVRPGIGATLTANANGVFPTLNGIDPTAYTSNSLKILVQDEANADYNGIYNLINIGTASSPWMLVRTLMVSSYTIAKKVVCVSNSDSSEYGKLFACNVIEIANINVGTDSITFSEISGGGDNFANADLQIPALTDRLHDFNGNKMTFDNAELKIKAADDTSGDVPFEITQADGATSIFKVTGDKELSASGNFTQTSAGNITHALVGGQCFLTMTTGFTSGSFTADNFGNFYVQNTANGGFLHLRTTGTSGVIDISSSGIIRVLNGLPVYADDTAAAAGGVLANQLYKTATGEIRIKL